MTRNGRRGRRDLLNGGIVVLGLAVVGLGARRWSEHLAPEVGAAFEPRAGRPVVAQQARGSLAPRYVPRAVQVERAPELTPLAAVGEGGSASAEEIAVWVAALAHDNVPGNARDARARLARAGQAARPALEEAVHSLDHQQRQLAAHLLRRLGGEPSQQLLLVSLEGLRHDRIPADPDGGLQFLHLPNAREGAAFLVPHAARVVPELLSGLQSVDGQQRLLCAYVLAASRTRRGLAHTTRVLIESLADNDVRGDAVLASSALYQLGELGLPYVRSGMLGADEQAGSLLRLVELDVRQPPTTELELRERGLLHSATYRIPDPAVQCDIHTGGLVEWGDRLSRDAGLGPRYGRVR